MTAAPRTPGADDLLERIYAQADVVSQARVKLGELILQLEHQDREVSTVREPAADPFIWHGDPA